ncbi:Acg family FMN-binding oxidoreductase [Umezawaea sp. Da 62-37]|uniref:Acg family FMN-binding oxidoreductase n=1 Tax=Umezawaea sp. Da 62-37 TaxID=3075927 RepID=UPI0028F6D312|nr:nitroreductase [Umezawaea sp. Da 62-37]WNV84798.1 nitroreductase [Umezawaea sp. Da 62-37]
MTVVVGSLGLAPEQTLSAIGTASLAPSVRNSQPWRFRLLPDRIELHADPVHALPVTDPTGRELRLSCGAALFTLRLALKSFGVRPLVTLLPDTAAPGLLATVRLGGRVELTDETRELLSVVPGRHTNRLPFAEVAVPVAHGQALVRAAELERSWLHIVSDQVERARLRYFVARADRLQKADPAVVAELAAVTDAAGSASAPLRSHDEWWLGAAPPVLDGALGEDREPEPLVVVLNSHYEGPLGELLAGQALQRVLLTATTLGLSTSFLAQPIEVGSVRAELRRSLGGSLVPQTVLRIGYGTPAPPTPRRPVSDLLDEPTSAAR